MFHKIIIVCGIINHHMLLLKDHNIEIKKCHSNGHDDGMSDREPTRWQHNRIYPHPINPCVYTYDSRLYCCENVDAHCSSIIKL